MAVQQPRVNETLKTLASNCNLDEPADLFSVELASLLEEMRDSFENWDKHTPERFVFDLLVRRANTAVVDYWDQILEIIAANIDSSKEYELRIDMLALIEYLQQ